MVERITTTLPPPPFWWAPPPDHELYVPEDAYFVDQADFPLAQFAHVTIQSVGQWADRYEAFIVGEQHDMLAGAVPIEPPLRQEVLSDVFKQLVTRDHRVRRLAISLFSGKFALLEQHDGIPGALLLPPARFALLQADWLSAGLPPDAYYRFVDQQVVVEPVTMHGGLVRYPQAYSPRRWRLRDHVAAATIAVPGESERLMAFECAGRRFLEAIALRISELKEVDREIDWALIEPYSALRQRIDQLLSEVSGSKSAEAGTEKE